MRTKIPEFRISIEEKSKKEITVFTAVPCFIASHDVIMFAFQEFLMNVRAASIQIGEVAMHQVSLQKYTSKCVCCHGLY